MSFPIDMIGLKFGRWGVIERAENNKHNEIMWICECNCANKTRKVVNGKYLRRGKTKSCGCLKVKEESIRNTRIYKIYYGMKSRCENPSTIGFQNYGGRGIKICNGWSGGKGVHNFYKWSLENGYSDNLTIDRVDVNDDYSPSNCRWVTQKQQNNNRRNNHYLTINGMTKTIAEWTEECGFKQNLIVDRVKKGIPEDRLLDPPKKYEAGRQSGVKGIYWSSFHNKWRVQFRLNGKKVYLGLFVDLEDARHTYGEYLNSSH